MNEMRASSSRRQIEEQAADWLVRRDRGAADEAQLNDWLTDPAHAVAYFRLEAVWEAANRLQVLGAGTTRAGSAETREFSGQHGSAGQHDSAGLRGLSGMRRFWAAAASVILTLSLFAWVASGLRGNRYSTTVGGIATVPMADGSRITLNTDSSVSIAISKDVRRVELERGEAFFDVAKEHRPFIVAAGDKRVTAVGTMFSVRKDGASVSVVVSEGRVRVDADSSAAGSVVSAGQSAQMRGDQISVDEKPAVEAEQALRWRGGYVVFEQTRLADAVAELNRYNVRKIRIVGPAGMDTRLCGAVRTENIDGFVRVMRDLAVVDGGVREGGVRDRTLPDRAVLDTSGSGAPARAEVSLPKLVHVPAGSLAAAMKGLVGQTEAQVLYECDRLEGFKTLGASGDLTGQQALAALVQGTALSLEFDASGLMLVVAPGHFMGPP
jgi:transmembrane sensor